MQKILFVHHGTGVGGAPISMIETIKSLDYTKYSAEVLLIKDSVVRDMLSKEGIVCSVAEGYFYGRMYRFFAHIEPQYFRWWQVFRAGFGAFLWLLSRYVFSYLALKKHDFDILHLNSSVLVDFLAAGKAKGKVVIHIREPVATGYLGLRLWILRAQIRRFADRVIAISNDNAKRLGCSNKTTVVYNFAEIDSKEPSPYPEEKLVLYVGGDSFIKGFLTIVGALDHLDDGVKVLFCGYYEDEPSSSSFLSRLKSTFAFFSSRNRELSRARKIMRGHPRAVLLGVRSDIPELLRKSRVLVSPFAVEHFSRPVVEAFANHRCAIGTDVEGMSEIIDNEINGLLVERNNHFALAAAINKVCRDDRYSMKLAEAGYSKAKLLFSRENIKKIQSAYDNL